MEQWMTQGEQNLLLLERLIPSGEKLYIWCYNRQGQYIASSCPTEERDVLQRAFEILGVKEKILQQTCKEETAKPLFIGSPIGMQWAVTVESERKQELIFVVGPVFYTAPTERQLRTALRPFMNSRANAAWSRELYQVLPELPVLSYAIFTRYVIMVHNTLTGQQLGLGDVNPGQAEPRPAEGAAPEARDRNHVYLAERALLQMVRNGDISYQYALQNSVRLSPGVPIQGQEPLRQMKTSIVVFTTLVSRAAMEGGLSPEVAYALGDSYIQSAEDCRDSGELNALAHAMYHDFIYRVHHLRVNPNYSHAIQKCCDYIELSLNRKIKTADLAELVGYTEYYLTEKFKKETGQSVSSYIRYAKVERAKVLLETSDLTIREIAEHLAFNTVNYFIQCFRDVTGYTPAQYRKKFRQKYSKVPRRM